MLYFPPLPTTGYTAPYAATNDYSEYYRHLHYMLRMFSNAGYPPLHHAALERQTPLMFHSPHIRAWMGNPRVLLQVSEPWERGRVQVAR